MHRRGELLGVEQEPAVAVEVDHRPVGGRELGADGSREAEAQAAQVQGGEQASGLVIVQPVLTVVGSQPGVQGDYGVPGHDLPKLRVDALGLDGQAG